MANIEFLVTVDEQKGGRRKIGRSDNLSELYHETDHTYWYIEDRKHLNTKGIE